MCYIRKNYGLYSICMIVPTANDMSTNGVYICNFFENYITTNTI